MINGRNVIAIIPARSGSKGLAGKNIKPLCGKPLIGWSLEKAMKSKFIDEIVVSTDSMEIAEIAKSYGDYVPFLRPQELATDLSSSFDVVKHVHDFFRTKFNRTYFYTILLEPTSPLREDDDIDNMLIKLDEKNELYDSLVSVGLVSEHPSIIKKLEKNKLVPFCEETEVTTRRQDNIPAYFPYGVGYICKTDVLLKEKNFYAERCDHYLIKRYQNYEIDDIYDFVCVEAIMKSEWGIQ